MEPIVETIGGVEYTAVLSAEALSAILTPAAIQSDHARHNTSIADAVVAHPGQWSSGGATSLALPQTLAMWARLATTGDGHPEDRVRAILEAALIGGGTHPHDAMHAAAHIYRHHRAAAQALVRQIVEAVDAE